MYDPIDITHVRFMVRELFTLCESLIIKEYSLEDIEKVIKKMYGLLECLDHSRWHMETF
jgi:hypothetical protein